MTSPFFSVVIPTYNRESTLAETLASVAAQEFQDFECIVVDDGSTDGTVAIAQSFPFVRVICQQNSGPGVARNTGVNAAKGQYMAFLDSDDVWFPLTLSNYANVISQCKSPAFVTGKPQLFYQPEELSICVEHPVEFESFADYFSSGDEWRWFGVSSFVIRRDLFLQVGGFADGRINGEDADLAMRLGIAPGFVHVTSPTQFGYRVHEGNVTNDTTKSQAGLQLLLNGEGEGLYPGGHQRAGERARIIARHVRPFAISLAQSGRAWTAFRFYRAVLGEALQNHRWKFLLGLPLLAISGLMRRSLRAGRVSFGC
ncbi:MAG: glycosyltransferase family A protein [Planctomycetales bacterium]|nr:glycosyltransferase family A protein [Planctomycetales bacterium]